MRIGRNEVAVPSHFFKALLTEDDAAQWSVFAFVVPNREPPTGAKPTDYQVAVDDLESLLEDDLFKGLPDQTEAAIERSLLSWPP